MGLGGIGIWQLLIVLAIVILLFGTKRLKSLGSDLGGAIKGFRNSLNADSEAGEDNQHKTAPLEKKNSTESSGDQH